MADKTWTWTGSRIVRVVDGDTIDAIVTRDLGFGGTTSFLVRLRLHRINAPASSSVRGKAAKARVVELLTEPSYTIITVRPYKYGGPRDYTGEYMAEVLLGDGRNLSDVLIGEGLAVEWDGTGPRPADD